jgi:hypothetical protein
MVAHVIDRRNAMLVHLAVADDAGLRAAIDAPLSHPVATDMVDALFRALDKEPSDDAIDGMILMLEGQDIGAASGLWETARITPAVLALACRKLIATHKFKKLLEPADLQEACCKAAASLQAASNKLDAFMREFLNVDAILLEFAHDEWEKSWLLPQYRPMLARVLDLHATHGPARDDWIELIEREEAKLALESPEPMPSLRSE